MAERYGGKVVRTKVGDIYVSEQLSVMAQFSAVNLAVLGCIHCSISVLMVHYQRALFLKALESEGKTVSQFVCEVPEYITVRETSSAQRNQKESRCNNTATIKDDFKGYIDFSTVDGVRLPLKTVVPNSCVRNRTSFV